MPYNRQEIEPLVQAKFEDSYVISFKSKSPHGFHFQLDSGRDTKHLKVVKTASLKASDKNEIALLQAIDSEHVIKLEEFGELNASYSYLMFPNIEGSTLYGLKDDEWTELEIDKLCCDMAQAFKDMDKAGITHRDIKPKNIMRDRTTGKYIVLDLGIGYFMPAHSRDSSKIPIGSGSKFYSSPEQFYLTVGKSYELSWLTDQFSLGVIVYELATKRHPFITENSTEEQVYATAITTGGTRLISEHVGIYSEKLTAAVAKMLAVEPSQRFVSFEKFEVAFGKASSSPATYPIRTYLSMHNKHKEEFDVFLNDHQDEATGVILTSGDTVARADLLINMGFEVIFDPKTYALQGANVGPTIAENLDLAASTTFDILDLMTNKSVLLDNVHALATKYHSDKILLPYFKVPNSDSMFLKFTKIIWREAREHYKATGQSTDNLYGGLIIPYEVIVDDDERAKLLSRLMGKYDIDGIFLVLENSADKIATTTEVRYLEGVKEIIHFFEANFNDVLVNRADLSVLPFLSKSAYSVGWAKGARHFSADSSGWNNGVYKMKFYAPPIFTFIEEQQIITTILAFGGADLLECDCTYCDSNNFLDPAYAPDEVAERHHFFDRVLTLRQLFAGKDQDERDAIFKEYLDNASALSARIRTDSRGVVNTEIVPSYIGLKSLIDY